MTKKNQKFSLREPKEEPTTINLGTKQIELTPKTSTEMPKKTISIDRMDVIIQPIATRNHGSVEDF